MKPRVFIDGEAGTTGLQIRARLLGRNDIELVSIDPNLRKDDNERKRLLNSVDLAVLCLHDDVARQAIGMIENPNTRVLDASTAHRVAPGWEYGFPELCKEQPQKIREARFVANVGCYATGAIALLRPLIDAGVLTNDAPISIQGTSGYSGGGRQLIDAFSGKGEHHLCGPYRGYGLNLKHKHVPEIKKYSGLTRDPIFTPAVGNFAQGMLVQVPLHLETLHLETLHLETSAKKSVGEHLQEIYASHYANQKFVRILPLVEDASSTTVLNPETLNNTNMLEIIIFLNQESKVALLVARLDNLGKGASGAAAQNIDVMLGLSGNRNYELLSED